MSEAQQRREAEERAENLGREIGKREGKAGSLPAQLLAENPLVAAWVVLTLAERIAESERLIGYLQQRIERLERKNGGRR